jgi:hypothetical protein
LNKEGKKYISLFLVFILLLNTSCVTIYQKKQIKLCEEQIKPEYNNSILMAFGRDLTSNRELKNFFITFPDSKEKYESYESKETFSYALRIGGMILMIGGVVTMLNAGLSPDPKLSNDERNAIITGGLIGMIVGFVMMPFSVWMQQESKNDLFESIYRYNYNCQCLVEVNRNNMCNGFYFPKKDFFGGIYFKNLCGNEEFTLDSKEGIEKFSIAPDFFNIKNNIQTNQFYGEILSIGFPGLLLFFYLTKNIFLYEALGLSMIPWTYFIVTIDETIMNNVFYLLSEINTCCCQKK